MVGAIILAAGESQRMGQLKPLIKIGDKNFLQHIIGQLRVAGIEQICVVLGYQAEKIQAEADQQDVEFIYNSDYRLGQFSSLQAGIKGTVRRRCQAVVVCLGDQPHIRSKWVEQLVEAHEKSSALIVVPKYRGRRGHPVLYAQSLFAEILSIPPSQSAQELRMRHTANSVELEIEDAEILLDADTPDDLERIKQLMSL